MRVQEVILENGKRYILVDSDGVPVIPVQIVEGYREINVDVVLQQTNIIHLESKDS